jgi:hypothetical protein
MIIARLMMAWMVLGTAASAATVHRWSEPAVQGDLHFVQQSWRVQNEAGSVEVPPDSFAWATFPAATGNAPTHALILRDGSRITGAIGPFRAGTDVPLQRGEGETAASLSFPAERVAALEFASLDPGAQVAAQPGKGHYLIMRDGRVLTGSMEWATGMEVAFTTAGGRLRIPRERVHRMVFESGPQPAEASIRVTTVVGDAILGHPSSMDAHFLTLRKGGTDIALPVDQLLSIHRHDQRIRHLTDLTLREQAEHPYFDFIRPHRLDTDHFGGPLIVGGIPVSRGVAMHSRTRLTWDLPPGSTHFTALVGIDSRISDAGRAVVRILVDDAEIWSDTLTAGRPPQRILVQVAGARLSLVVDYGEAGSIGDHVVWAQPQVMIRSR